MKSIWPTKKLVDVLTLYDNGIWGLEDLVTGVSVLRSTNFNNDGTISFDNVALRRIETRNLNKKNFKVAIFFLKDLVAVLNNR